jgi:hypothetical protein
MVDKIKSDAFAAFFRVAKLKEKQFTGKRGKWGLDIGILDIGIIGTWQVEQVAYTRRL